ncbi:MAG: hypothetical protein R2744_04545 [Bacteroidales bacterium]
MLFRGKAEVSGGLFTLTFLVPKDIDYSYGAGKLSFTPDPKGKITRVISTP